MSELALKRISENIAKHERGEDARILKLHMNDLPQIPSILGYLTWLEELSIKGRRHNFKKLSPNFGNLINLKKLTINGETDLNDDYDSCIEDISELSHLVNLEWLSLYDSNVKDITPLKNLYKLRYIDISFTHVRDLSPLKNLHQIEDLSFGYSGVTDIYPLLSLIKKGLKVSSYGVKITNPPIEIVNQGSNAIIKYFEELEKAKQEGQTIRLSEAKCLLIGEGGAGKTSLAQKLLDQTNPLPEEQATTKGIDVYPHDLKLFDGTDFRLNIWDFGGQEIYHATHQFFLTKRSLYILLDDTRKDEKTVNDPSFNYWLQVAQLYGGNSPLLIVQNEKGDRSKQLDLKGMQGRFGFVKDAKGTNLLTCRGLDKVWEAIKFWLKQLPHIGEEQPKAWVDIRRELERLAREEGHDHISLEAYYRICTQYDIPEKDRALFLSSYLHDFGAFLHFQDHPLLKRMLVLNNQWATDAVYKVLDCEEVKSNFGRFTRDTLGHIWADERYADQHDELLALMEKFELCYKLPDEKEENWLAPQLLSVLQPNALTWNDNDNLQIRYEYEFMPKGLLSQHIVRNHRYIRQTELAWRSGAVFERAGALALVTEAWGSRNIRIRARGVHAKELLTLLSEDFDRMHERLEGLKVRKMIPCNCRGCIKAAEPHFYDFDKLQRRKMDGKRTVECDVSYKDVSVVGLLDGIFAKNIGAHVSNKATSNPAFISLFQKGKIEKALELMPDCEDKHLLLGQLANIEERKSKGLISEENYALERNRIQDAALKLAKNLDF